MIKFENVRNYFAFSCVESSPCACFFLRCLKLFECFNALFDWVRRQRTAMKYVNIFIMLHCSKQPDLQTYLNNSLGFFLDFVVFRLPVSESESSSVIILAADSFAFCIGFGFTTTV